MEYPWWLYGVATSVAIAAATLYVRRYSKLAHGTATEGAAEDFAEGTADSGSQPSPSSKKRRHKPSKKGAEVPIEDANEAARNFRPPIAVGERCWHRTRKEFVHVTHVYYDNPPPYYSVRLPDGTEISTVRGRIDTAAERAAEVEAEERMAAEARAEAAAAALLAEEAAASEKRGAGRRPTSKKK
jgi:hypothetical protein